KKWTSHISQFAVAIIQRVLSASVTVDQEVVSSIGKGVLVFAAVAPGDTDKEITTIANKVLKMKLWDDEAGGKWKKNVMDIEGEVLCVSQFTLLAKTKKGTKPDFHGAMGPDEAIPLYHSLVQKIGAGYSPERVKDGKFQAMMQVALVNDGPVCKTCALSPLRGSARLEAIGSSWLTFTVGALWLGYARAPSWGESPGGVSLESGLGRQTDRSQT
ncbi:unnamed protein product, partial [Clonostachys rhizophaga]